MLDRNQNRRPNVCLSVAIFILSVSLGFSKHANGQDLRVASPDAPQYALSDLRVERDQFGRSVLAVDYKLKAKGDDLFGPVTLSGKTRNGPLRIMAGEGVYDSGVLRISVDEIRMRSMGRMGMRGFGGMGHVGVKDFEVYFVVDEYGPSPQVVSNILRLGDPGPETKPRPWTEEEKSAAAKKKLLSTPPSGMPEEHVPANQGTPLVPGMPVKAGLYGEWVDAEVISFKVGGDVMLKYESEDRLHPHKREKWIAISREVLAKAKEDPGQFYPSVQALKDSRSIIPDGAVALTSDVVLVPGTPLLMEFASRWRDVYFLEANGSEIKMRDKVFGSRRDKEVSRDKFIISNKVLKKLQEPDAVAKFAPNIALKEPLSGSGFPSRSGSKTEKTFRHKKYYIDIKLPENSSLVPGDLKVEYGTALAGCYNDKWCPLTALHENEDGSIHVRWDEFSSGFDCNMTRDQLVIENEVIENLRRKAQTVSDGVEAESKIISASDLKQILRTWTDNSGKYKMEAWYVSHDARQIKLKTAAGREIRMPFDMLSAADREMLSAMELDEDIENPFE